MEFFYDKSFILECFILGGTFAFLPNANFTIPMLETQVKSVAQKLTCLHHGLPCHVVVGSKSHPRPHSGPVTFIKNHADQYILYLVYISKTSRHTISVRELTTPRQPQA